MPETIANEPKLYQKTLDAIKIVEAGIDPAKALQLVNNGRKVSDTSVSSFKSKLRKHSLTQPKVVKLAHKALIDCLKGETSTYTAEKVTKDGDVVQYQEVIAPTVTNKVAAASLVYDRYEPVIKQVANINLNMDCSPVDLSKYVNSDVVNNTQDAEYEDAKT
jgi:hypothetical protein